MSGILIKVLYDNIWCFSRYHWPMNMEYVNVFPIFIMVGNLKYTTMYGNVDQSTCTLVYDKD